MSEALAHATHARSILLQHEGLAADVLVGAHFLCGELHLASEQFDQAVQDYQSAGMYPYPHRVRMYDWHGKR